MVSGTTVYNTPTVYNENITYKVIGGKNYKTIIMPDGKEWLAENLDFKFCHIGGAFEVSSGNAWYYNNDEYIYGWNGYKCGLLYNWFAVKILNDFKNELIPGWHVPTSTEWINLSISCGGNSISGKKLKAQDDFINNWPINWNGTNEYNFSVLPAGSATNGFYNIDVFGIFWASDTSGSDACRVYFSSSDIFSPDIDNKKYAYSLRLVRD